MLLSKLLIEADLIECEKLTCTGDDPEISGVRHSSKEVKKGEIFIAIEGLRADGHCYLNDAAERGAAALIVSRSAVADGRVEDNYKIPVIAVDDTRRASAKLFAAWYGNPQKRLRMVGVTGTNGKTTTSRLIYETLVRSGENCGLIGTLGCMCSCGEIGGYPRQDVSNMTTPDPEELYKVLDIMARLGVETVIMEVSSHALHFGKVAPINFEVSVFTNLTEDHLDLHGDMESYFEAKALLFASSKKAIVNVDDNYGRRLAEKIDIPTLGCTMEGRNAACYVEDARQKGVLGCEYKLVTPNMRLRVRSMLAGDFNIMNTMQAAVCAQMLGASVGDIRTAFALFSGVDGRLERIKLPKDVDFSVFIDYAHTPDALEKLLRTARGFADKCGRIVLLFGCGGDRERQKRATMGRIATALADMVIITGDNSRGERTADIINDILAGVERESCFIVIEDRRSAIEYAIKTAKRGDVVLLAGKGHEDYEVDSFGKKPFVEKEIVISAIEKYY